MYSIPNPNLPMIPVPKGGTAADYCEALECRDQEIRKSEVFLINEATRNVISTCSSCQAEVNDSSHTNDWYMSRYVP